MAACRHEVRTMPREPLDVALSLSSQDADRESSALFRSDQYGGNEVHRRSPPGRRRASAETSDLISRHHAKGRCR